MSRTTPNEDEGRYSVLLEEVREVALGDSGANYSTISSAVFAVTRETYPATFEKLMMMELAIRGGTDMASSIAVEKTQLSLTIIFPNTSLPVRIRDIEFLIADDDIAEVLLNRPLLKPIKFDLGKHLQNVGAAIKGMSEEEMKSETARLASRTFKVLSYGEADDDQIELPECLQAGFGIESHEVIHEAVLKAVENAKANGI